MIRIVIRANDGPNIGMGHVQRCLALGNKLKKNRAEILFICKKDEATKKKINQEGFEVIALNDNIGSGEDLKDAINAIKNRGVDVVITDSYTIGEHYLTEIKKMVPLLVSIDDLANISFPSDIVINQNIYAKGLHYHSSTGKTKFLLGPEYALLRQGFSSLGKRRINEKVKNILVTLGGTDFFNLTPRILKILDRIGQNFEITVIIGLFFKNIAEIEKAAEKINKKVELVYDSREMSKIMLASDLAITGGGTTLYELAATGTPALAFCLANNQLKNIKGIGERGTVVNLGWANDCDRKRLCKEMLNLINNHALRQEMSKKGQEMVDGQGALRCGKVVLDLILGKLRMA